MGWTFVILFLLGMIFGFFLGHFTEKTDGIIVVDDREEGKTKWLLDVRSDPLDIPKKKCIRLKVLVQK